METALEASRLTCRFGDTLAVAGVDFRVAVLERGKVIALGSPSELAHRVVKTHNLAIEVEPDQVAHAESIARNRAVDAVVIRSKGALIPLIMVPLLFFGVLPLLAVFAPTLVNISGISLADLNGFVAPMPAGLRADQQIVVFVLTYLFAPMYLIVPLMVASVIVADMTEWLPQSHRLPVSVRRRVPRKLR